MRTQFLEIIKMKNSNCLELEVISESRRKRWKIKAKTRKSEDRSKSSYLKIPGISEKENRKQRRNLQRKTQEIFSELKDTFPD